MNLAKLFKKLSEWPLGKHLFSCFASIKVPYFASICPLVLELDQTHCVVKIKKRFRVKNHIGTVHVIALCNLCEMAFGLTMEAGIPGHLRWIPRGMTTRYIKKGETHMVATCDYPQILTITPGDHVVPVKVRNTQGEIVMEADITVYITQKPSRAEK